MHVAVLGAGYAGVALARKLEDRLPDAELTVVDERDTHLVQHLAHRAVRYPAVADELTVPFEELFDRATHRQSRVTGLDPDAGRAELADGDIEFDVGAVALGAETNFYGIPGAKAHSTPLKRLEHAERIRERFLEVCVDDGRVVVAGAGLSGVQVAGELAALADKEGSDAEVTLLEQEPEVAPNFPERFRRAVREELDDAGVDVRTGRTVTGVEAGTVALEPADELAFDQLVWTGGITGSEPLGERPVVRADLRLGDSTFAVGDAARVVDADGEPAPASAQTAVREADVAATNIERLVTHRRDADGGFEPRLDRYEYTSLGWLVSVGDAAVAQVGPTVLRGRAAETAKETVAAGYLGSLGAVDRAMGYVQEH
ncbi:MAG: FAD-dependent oxidoreductase [Haloarculaceae archaeon]